MNNFYISSVLYWFYISTTLALPYGNLYNLLTPLAIYKIKLIVYDINIQINMPKTLINLKSRKVMKRDSIKPVVPISGDWHVSLPLGFFN